MKKLLDQKSHKIYFQINLTVITHPTHSSTMSASATLILQAVNNVLYFQILLDGE